MHQQIKINLNAITNVNISTIRFASGECGERRWGKVRRVKSGWWWSMYWIVAAGSHHCRDDWGRDREFPYSLSNPVMISPIVRSRITHECNYRHPNWSTHRLLTYLLFRKFWWIKALILYLFIILFVWSAIVNYWLSAIPTHNGHLFPLCIVERRHWMWMDTISWRLNI